MINLEDKEILIVEDDDMNFIYLKQIFNITKGSVERVKTGKLAIEKCREKEYDFIMMDIQLLDISGTETTRKIREFNPTIPIIAQTAAKTPTEIDEILESGCNHVLVKPFKFEELTETLKKFI